MKKLVALPYVSNSTYNVPKEFSYYKLELELYTYIIIDVPFNQTRFDYQCDLFFLKVKYVIICHSPFILRSKTSILHLLVRETNNIQHTTQWDDLMRTVSNTNKSKIKLLVIRYVFQSAIHSIWRERNREDMEKLLHRQHF